jgi:hypothetical protein
LFGQHKGPLSIVEPPLPNRRSRVDPETPARLGRHDLTVGTLRREPLEVDLRRSLLVARMAGIGKRIAPQTKEMITTTGWMLKLHRP